MGVGENFQSFCSNLTVDNRDSISARYKRITRRLNLDFWESVSDTNHSMYVGSYGRDTAIRGLSDLDILFRLPYEVYQQYNSYQGNGQSALLQAVRNSLQRTYSSSHIAGDGQVVAIEFDDGVTFEILPAFLNKDDSFTYPDSNDEGRWRITNPQPEIQAIAEMNHLCNHNLKWLCRMARAWRNEWSAPIGGLLIDTLAHNFIRDWAYRDKSYVFYDWMSRDFFAYLAAQDEQQDSWRAVGSGRSIERQGVFEHRAKRCYNLACEAIKDENDGYTALARKGWKEIYGSCYP